MKISDLKKPRKLPKKFLNRASLLSNKLEIEKKYLLLSPDLCYGDLSKNLMLYDKTLRQGDYIETFYIPTKYWDTVLRVALSSNVIGYKINTVRVRKITKNDNKGITYILSIKGKKSKDKTTQKETEYKIDENTYGLLSTYFGPGTRKKRLVVKINNQAWEIDAFIDRYLLLAELEVSNAREFNKITTPWLDVTGIEKYSGKSLAK